jgi:hypothetical protein
MKFGLHTKYDHTKSSSDDANKTIFISCMKVALFQLDFLIII